MIDRPRLHHVLTPLDNALIHQDYEFERATLADVAWGQSDAQNAELHEVRLTRPDLIGSNFRQSGFIDVAIDHGVLSGMSAVQALWRRVEVIASRCDGLVAYGAQLFDVTFQNCRLDTVNFRGARLRNIAFINCSMREVDFGEVMLSRAQFIDCDLSGADFSRAKLKDVDLRRAQFSHVNGFTGLRGAKLTYQQVLQLAPAFARQAGVIIEDETPQ